MITIYLSTSFIKNVSESLKILLIVFLFVLISIFVNSFINGKNYYESKLCTEISHNMDDNKVYINIEYNRYYILHACSIQLVDLNEKLVIPFTGVPNSDYLKYMWTENSLTIKAIKPTQFTVVSITIAEKENKIEVLQQNNKKILINQSINNFENIYYFNEFNGIATYRCDAFSAMQITEANIPYRKLLNSNKNVLSKLFLPYFFIAVNNCEPEPKYNLFSFFGILCLPM